MARLSRLHPKLIDLSLDRITALLDRLGNPQAALPPVIHAAGTNGKGSVIAFLRAMIEAQGHAVHAYTSPHLLRFNERILLAGRAIGDDQLSALMDECEAANGGAPITFFEITTAMAFVAFARAPADATLLETGLGGRLDATNVVEHPALTVLTPISMDHEDFLGADLAAIAGEKAAIMKPGVPCVTAEQPPEAEAVIAQRARSLGVPLLRAGADFSARARNGRLVFEDGDGSLDLPLPSLNGDFQIANAGLAIAAARAVAGLKVGPKAIAAGLTGVLWPARLQRLAGGDPAPGWELWLDGGHNEAAARVLAIEAEKWRGKPLDLVFGMLRNKDAKAFLECLAPHIGRLAAVTIPGEDTARDPAELVAIGESLGIEGTVAPSLKDAVSGMPGNAAPPARILICGSLYLAASALAEFG